MFKMKNSKGDVRKILVLVGEIQDLIGAAIAGHYDDRDPNSFEVAQKSLSEAFKKCIEATGFYYPVEVKKHGNPNPRRNSRPTQKEAPRN